MASELMGGSLQVCRLRVARLNPDGTHAVGVGNLYVTDTLIQLATAADVTEGTEFELPNGCGDIVVSHKDADRFKRLTATLQLAKPDPELTEMLVGGSVLRDVSQNVVGYAAPEVGTIDSDGVSLEAWTKHIVAGEQDPDFPWIRWVFPRTRWTIGDRTLENAALVTNFSGFCEPNSSFGNGPANDYTHPNSGRVYSYALAATAPAAAYGAQATAPQV